MIELHTKDGERLKVNPNAICAVLELRDGVLYPEIKSKVMMVSGASHYVKEDYEAINKMMGEAHGRSA
jgi:hypothetical protein